MTKPNEPTLTCSEVVERLFQEAYEPNTNYHESNFDTALAEKILHSWRERRVQELEELLAKRPGCSHCNDSASRITRDESASEIRRNDE